MIGSVNILSALISLYIFEVLHKSTVKDKIKLQNF